MPSALLLALAIALNSAANLLFRHASTIAGYPTHKLSLLGIGLFVGLINTLCYIKSLEEVPLGTAFPVYSAASILIIAVAAGVLFGEPWPAQKIAGVITICVGIVILSTA